MMRNHPGTSHRPRECDVAEQEFYSYDDCRLGRHRRDSSYPDLQDVLHFLEGCLQRESFLSHVHTLGEVGIPLPLSYNCRCGDGSRHWAYGSVVLSKEGLKTTFCPTPLEVWMLFRRGNRPRRIQYPDQGGWMFRFRGALDYGVAVK